MRTMPRVCRLLLTMGLCTVTANAQVSRAVIVSRAGGQIDISVNRSTPLGTVLDEICRESNAQCDGTEQAMGVMVPAQQISGDWSRVLSSLLDGTDLNYATREPAESSAAVLSITGIASRAGSERPDRPVKANMWPARNALMILLSPRLAAETAASMSTSSSGDLSAETTSRPEAVSTGSAPPSTAMKRRPLPPLEKQRKGSSRWRRTGFSRH